MEAASPPVLRQVTSGCSTNQKAPRQCESNCLQVELEGSSMKVEIHPDHMRLDGSMKVEIHPDHMRLEKFLHKADQLVSLQSPVKCILVTDIDQLLTSGR